MTSNPGSPPLHRRMLAEQQWTLRKGNDRARCEFRITIDFGCEVHVVKNGELVIAQLFENRAQADIWAELTHQQLIRDGWKPT